MSLNFQTGNFIQEVELDLSRDLQKKELSIDLEILDIGSREGKVILFGAVKNMGKGQIKERMFLLVPSGTPLPKLGFANYFWHLGTLPKKGLHVFEVV